MQLSWGIDRIDQQKLPLNQKYTYNSVGGSDSLRFFWDTLGYPASC